MIQQITETITSPAPAMAVTGSVATATFFGVGLPEVIQFFTAVYAVLLAVHKIYQMYQDFKGKKTKSEQE